MKSGLKKAKRSFQPLQRKANENGKEESSKEVRKEIEVGKEKVGKDREAQIYKEEPVLGIPEIG